MDMGFSCRKNAFFQASIKLAHPFPAPELRTKILRTLKGFSDLLPGNQRLLKIHQNLGARPTGLYSRKGVFLPQVPSRKSLLGTPSKNPS